MKYILTVLLLFSSIGFSQTKIGILDLHNLYSKDKELQSAYNFLEDNKDFEPKLLNHEDILNSSFSILNYNILWLHRADSVEFTKEETDPRIITQLKTFVENGGKLFLTLAALLYLNLLGFETEIPTVQYVDAIDEGYGRKLGLHSFRSHPIFSGLNGGAYMFNPTTDMKTRQVGFFGNSIPRNGKVAAVDWSYITLKEDSKLVVEYEIGKGTVLAVGAYTYFSIPNNSRKHLELFTDNCLNYLAGKIQNEKKYYWNYSSNQVIQLSAFGSQLSNAIHTLSKSWNTSSDLPVIKNQFGTDNFWNVAGERMLVMGKEKGGIDEIWAHPFMALHDYEVGIQFLNIDSICWLNNERPKIEVRPESFTRIYKLRNSYLTEIIIASHDEPSAIVHYEYRGDYPAKLIIKFKSNLRFMWPYSERVLGSTYYTWNDSLNSFLIKDESGDHFVVAGANRKPHQHMIGRYENFEKSDSLFKSVDTKDFIAGASAQYKLGVNDNLDFVIAATNEGFEAALKSFEISLSDPEKVYTETSKYAKKFLDNSLVITTPDGNFNEGYKWSLIGTDRFFVNTPGLGKALTAGYSTTAKGWNGGHKVNGRPGYGWYFGRDAVWSSFALLDYGDFEKVKEQLKFFNKYQDLNGKIFHELTTSGAVHYDASDATPLYIILAGRYLLHTGDVEFIKQTWQHIKKAIDFCFSTDTDKDHLIENTNVGHGWVEGGGLYTAHTEVYLAACWAEALRLASVMAEQLMQNAECRMYSNEHEVVKRIINEQFWSGEKKFLSFSKLKDGSYNSEKTVLSAVPVYFDLLDSLKAKSVIDDYAENYFSSDWGVRILRDDSPIYNPRGYHTGSVWPLFTGWTALAEFKYGNYVQGFTHIMNNLLVYKNWQLGFVEEVLHGEEYRPSGVCSHQCWSQTMVLQPAIEGMLGLKVDALNNIITLSPCFPADWDFVKVEKIRIGDTYVDFQMNKRNGKTVFLFTSNSSQPIQVEFNPAFPLDTKFISAQINNSPVIIEQYDNRTIPFSFILNNSTQIEINHSGGISVLPKIIVPEPNSHSEGFRILSERIWGNEYIISLQGVSETANELQIWKDGKIEKIAIEFEKSTDKYLNKAISLKLKNQTEH
ncbi:MAG: amylo-alpha-1,6-glucosidase [Bacteroidota bacterium]